MTSFIKEHVDYKTIFVTLALVGIGLISIYSATYDAGASDNLYRQLLYAGAGIFVMTVIMLIPSRFLPFVSYPTYFFSILLLIAVLLLGRTVSGSTSWFNMGAFRLQPSEFAKITTAMALATYLSRTDVSLHHLKHLMIAAGIVLLPVGLIMMQPDTGTALIYCLMFLPVLYWGGATKFTMVALAAPVIAAITALIGTTPFLLGLLAIALLIYLTMEHRIIAAVVFSVAVLVGISVQSIYDSLKPYQQKRIATFLDPGADPLGAGYNVLQSKVAIGSGGLLGKGYLHGTQTQLNFIPEQWTDFIFCVPGEEFGFFGAATVLLLYLVLLIRGIRLGSTVKNRFGSSLAIGLTAIFFAHMFINVGMALGLLPVIGVPLPFLSYGGSALLTSMTIIGILLNLYANRKEY